MTTSPPERSKATPQRFPRIEKRHILAEITKRVWTRPEFIPRDTKEGTEFVFRVPIRQRFKQESAGLYRALFLSPGSDWERTLNQAYGVPLPDGKTVATMIDSHLYTIFLTALENLYREAEKLGTQYVEYVATHSRIFRGQARRSQSKARSVKQLNDKVLMEWARAYRRRQSEARKFIAFVEEHRSKMNDKELLQAVTKNLRFRWIKLVHPAELLRPDNLLPIPGGENKQAWPLSKFSLTEAQLAVAILREDFIEKHPTRPLTPKSFYELVIQRGNKLLREQPLS